MARSPLTRDWVVRRLTQSPNYWLATVDAGGRPHSTPVWGAWRGDALWWGTSDTSRKGRNLRARPDCVVHTESGDEVILLEGVAERVGDFHGPALPAEARAALDALAAKYLMSAGEMGGEGGGAGLYRLRPRRVRAWLEPLFPQTQTRWEPWAEPGATAPS